MYRTGLNSPNNKYRNYFIISDNNIEIFKNILTEKKIKQLNRKLKQYEKKGLVTYQKFLISMKSIFDSDLLLKDKENKNYNSNNDDNSLISDKSSYSSETDNNSNKINNFDELYDLIFERFREVKCIIKNNKSVFYLTEFKRENYINSYSVICALSIFIKTSFENKLKLLFYLSDIDEDGFLNKKEIEYMITTINLLFGEEINGIKMNSSILSQSLINIKINNILYELLYTPGGLYNKLVEEQDYITFEMLYESIKRITNYKYRIIPCFINLRDCLFTYKNEKIINVKEKHKTDFINISSSLVLEQNKKINKDNYKKFSLSNLNEIIKPIKIDAVNLNNFSHKEKKYRKLKTNMIGKFRQNSQKRKLLLNNDKSLKELIKNSTIFNENMNNNKMEFGKKFNYKMKLFQYAFQANLNNIRNIEVEPGIINFIPNEIQKNDENIININKMTPQSPQIKKKLTFNIDSQNEHHKLVEEVNKIIENNHDESNRSLYKYNTDIKNVKANHIKKFRPKLRESLSSNNVMRFLKKNTHKAHSQSIIYNKRNKNNILKLNNNNSNERYRTLDEIIREISKQEKKFNFESIHNVNSELIKEYKELKKEMIIYRRNSIIYNDEIKNIFNNHKSRKFKKKKFHSIINFKI